MTVRRFNYTGCKRILRADVEVVVEEFEGLSRFEAVYDLDGYDFPPEAEVVVEAFVGWTVMRFAFGTVGGRALPVSCELSDFGPSDGVRFRLKVLGKGDQQGLILGEADKIRPTELGDRAEGRSFLAVRPAELGDVVWRLSFDEAQPVLEVNGRLGNWQSFVRTPIVRSLLVPELMRQMLREALQNEADEDDASAWQNQLFAMAPMGAGARPSWEQEEAVEEWVDNVVTSIARRHRIWRGMAALTGPDGEV